MIHRIVEKRQPTIFLIECEDRRRAFRFETELTLIAEAEIDDENLPRFETARRLLSLPAPAPMIEPPRYSAHGFSSTIRRVPPCPARRLLSHAPCGAL